MTARQAESENKSYEVPAGFTPVRDGFLKASDVFGEGKRLWLFQVPKDVKLQDLNGTKLSFEKKKLRIGEKSYEISRNEGSSDVADLNVLVSDEDGQPVLMPADFSGVVTLNRSLEVPEPVLTGSSSPEEAATGRESARQRFVPFGSGEVVTLSKAPKKKKRRVEEEVQQEDMRPNKKSKKKKKKRSEDE